MVFNPANRHWYSGSGSNANDGGNCPSTNAGNVFPIVGVFQAAGTLTAPMATWVGTQYSGRNGSNLALGHTSAQPSCLGIIRRVTASFSSGIADANKELVISTTIGNEVVACGHANGRADCAGTLIGDPLIGGVTLLGNGGTVLAKGRIVLAK